MLEDILFVFVLGEFFVFVQGLLADEDGLLTVGGMNEHGWSKALPFLAHLGMWSDALVVTPLLAILVGMYGGQWPIEGLILALIVGVIISAGMHWTYTKAVWPEAHVQYGKLRPAGYLHAVYMALSLAILLMFYFATSNVAPALIVTVSVVLFFHIVIGTHVPIKIWAATRKERPVWFPFEGVIDAPTAATIFGVAVILAAGTAYALRK